MDSFRSYITLPYFYLALVILWIPISLITGIDGMGRIKIATTIVLVGYLLFKKRSYLSNFFSERCVVILAVLIIYMIANYLILYELPHNPAPHERLFKVLTLIYPFMILLVVYTEIIEGRSGKVINVILCSYYAWILLLVVYMGRAVTIMERMTLEGIDSNDFGLVSSLVIFMLYLRIRYFNMNPTKGIMLAILPLVLIIFTSSRTAMGCVCIVVALIMIDYLHNLNFINFAKILLSLAIIFGGFLYVQENTNLGKRIAYTTSQTENYRGLKTHTVLDKMGDRGVFYYYGYKAWKEEPVFGIGLGNFKTRNIFGGLVCHSEYMVQLCECGIIGIFLYLLYLFMLWRRIRYFPFSGIFLRKRVLYGALIMVLLVDTFFWSYDRLYIFILYGLIIGFTSNKLHYQLMQYPEYQRYQLNGIS